MLDLIQVDHQLMCLSMVDVTGDGLEEVICCSWDGQTYIISQVRSYQIFFIAQNALHIFFLSL